MNPANNYTRTVSSDIDNKELRIELDINNEMAVVITQESGIENAKIEFWYPKGRNSWHLEYHLFCRHLREMLESLARKKVSPISDPNENGCFSTQIDTGTSQKRPFVKLYFKEHYLGSISQEEGIDNAQLEIVACPYNKYWEFSYRGFTDLLRDGYQKLLNHSEI